MSRYLPEEVKSAVRAQANNQCGYCRSLQKYVLGILEIEHIIPTAAGGSNDEDNLWLSCRLCNSFKGAQTHASDPITGKRSLLFNPRRQSWSRHFEWSVDGAYILGRTLCGRATVNALQLNNPFAVTVRQAWISAGWHPPEDV
jgi:HNH endonuclease